MRVEYAGKTLTINDWENGELGITLPDPKGGNCPPDDFASPLVFDLDGDGIELTRLTASAAFFDIDNDGGRERVAWVAPDDGLLALDLNGNGVIDDANELFGYGTTFSSAGGRATGSGTLTGPGDLDIRYESGFDKLAALDLNLDGVIDALDTDFAALRMWRDLNQDGISQEQELFTLDEVGIASISTASTSVNQPLEDSYVTDTGTFQAVGGQTQTVSDVWFRFNQFDVRFEAPENMDPTLDSLPDLNGAGSVKNLRVAMAEDPGLRALVEQFAALIAADLAKVTPLVDEIVYRWAGVSSEDDATDRGVFADARHVAVLEAFSDTPFSQWSGPDPRPQAGAVLSGQYNNIQRDTAAQLIAQTQLGATLFPELSYEARAFLILADGINSADVLQRIVDSAPSDWAGKLAHFHAGIRLLDTVYLSFADVEAAADDGTAYRAAVEGILLTAGFDLDYEELMSARIDGSGGGSLLTPGNNQSGTVSLSGAGDDEVTLASGKQLFFWGAGQGNDELQMDPFDFAVWEFVPRVEIRLQDLTRNDVTLQRGDGRYSTDAAIVINSTGETLTIRNLLQASDQRSGTLVFSDGSTLTFDQLSSDISALAETGTDQGELLIQRAGTTLDGGAGNDVLQGSDGATNYVFDRGYGVDEIRDRGVDGVENIVTFGPGVTIDDLEFGRTAPNSLSLTLSLFGTSDRLTIYNQFAENTPVIARFVFEDGSELTANDITDIQLSDGPDDDVLYGTNGDDRFGRRGSDGNDVFIGLDGADRYDFEEGNGIDTVRDGGTDNAEDVVSIDFELNQLTITRDGDELTFLYEPTGDKLVVDNSNGRIEVFEFDDQDLTFADLVTLIDRSGQDGTQVLGTSGDDTLAGTAADETFLALSGNDTVTGNGGEDVFYGGEGDDNLTGGNENDALYGEAGADTLAGGGGDDYLDGGDRSETPLAQRAGNDLFGNAGNDTLLGGWEDDTLDGGEDDDLLIGSYGNDTYRGGAGNDVMVSIGDDAAYQYDLGDGDDLIFTDGGSRFDDYEVVFGAGIAQADLSFSFVQVDSSPYTDYYGFNDGQWALKASVAGGGSLTLAGAAFDDIGGVELFRFADGSTLSVASVLADLRTANNDDQLIVGSGRGESDVFAGGGGNDTIHGNAGSDSFSFGFGDGQDTIVAEEPDPRGFGGSMQINLEADVAPADMTISRAGEFDQHLVLTLSDGSSITVQLQFSRYQDVSGDGSPASTAYVQEVRFGDGTVIDADQLRAATMAATSGDDIQIGSDVDDAFSASAGNDEMRGGRGNDTYEFGLGSGADTIVETARDLVYFPDGFENVFDLSPLRETDTLTFGAGITLADLDLTRTGDGLADLSIEITATGESLLIESQFASGANWGRIDSEYALPPDLAALMGPDGEVPRAVWDALFAQRYGSEPLFAAGVERFAFADGTEYSRQEFAALVDNIDNDGDDIVTTDDAGGILDGGAGEDRLEGGAGDDLYVFNRGYFSDVATDKGGDDRVAFGGEVLPEDVAFTRTGENGNDLLIELGGSDRNSLLVEGQFAGDGREIEQFTLADGSVWTAEDIRLHLLDRASTNGSDHIVGFENDDLINGRTGDDVIEVRGGNDLVDGGDGRDTVVFRGPKSNFDIRIEGDETIVTDLVGNEGVNRLVNVEELRFSDEQGQTEEIEVLVANTAPVAGTINLTGREDTQLVLQSADVIPNAVDPDGDQLRLVSVSNPQNGTVELLADGRVVFSPAADFNGAATFDYTVRDAGGIESTGTATVNVAAVNDAPFVAMPLEDQSSPEDTAVSFVLPTGVFADVDGDTLMLSASLSDGSALPAWLSFDPGTSGFTGTPPLNFNAAIEVRVTASDSSTEASETFLLQVSPVNDAPTVLAPIADQSFDEDNFVSFTLPADTFMDIDGDVLGISATLADGSPLPSWLDFSAATGTFAGVPPQDFNGSLDVAVTATDGALAVSDTFTLTIVPINDAPIVAAPLSDQSSPENTAVNFVVPGNTFDDVDGDLLSLSASLADGSGLPAWLSFDANTRTFDGTPPLNFNGTINLLVTASDGELEASSAFALAITSVNDAPVVVVQLEDVSSPEDSAVSFVVPAGTFSDADGDTLTLAAALADDSALPDWLSFDPVNRSFTGTPPSDFHGTLNVTVTASDGELEAKDTFALEITPVNDAPVVLNALPDQSSPEDEAVSFVIPADAFEDVDGDALTLAAGLSDGSVLPDWLSFDPAARIFSGTPPQDFNGLLDVTVTASDGAFSVSDTFALAIIPMNDAPTAVDDSGFTATAGTPLTISSADLLANDLDVDGDTLQVVDVDGAQNGTVSLDGQGDVVYTPASGFSGTDTFTYTITDGAEVATAQVSVAVETDGGGGVVGTEDDDIIIGDRNDENDISGAGGNDIIIGGNGDDVLNGDAGHDLIYGGRGDDTINGGSGYDLLLGGKGNDTIAGGDDSDVIFGGRGNDEISGGAGDDLLFGGKGADQFVYRTGDGADEIYDYQTTRSYRRFTLQGDSVALSVAGVASFEDLMGFAGESNGDVVFDFGNGDLLILNDTQLAALDRDSFTYF